MLGCIENASDSLIYKWLAEIYEKVRLQNLTLSASFEKFVNGTLDGERGANFPNKGRVK